MFKQLGIFSTLLIIISMSMTPVFGAQFSTSIEPLENSAPFKVTFQRTLFFLYEEGGIWTSLQSQNWDTQIIADYSDPKVRELGQKITQNIQRDGSSVRINDLTVTYSALATGRASALSIDYKIILTGTITDHIIREEQGADIPALIDLAWRGISIDESVVINDLEINLPKSVIEKNIPNIYATINNEDALEILSTPLINSDDVKNQPLTNWHKLFDATGINVDAQRAGLSDEILGKVFTKFTMGESSFREGRQVEKIIEAVFTLDKEYAVRSVESASTAEITLLGFARTTLIENTEAIGVSKDASNDKGDTSTGEFPIAIIYGMAGMAGIGAIGILFISSRKLKKEGSEQTGIDPRDLQGFQTSSSSGSYQTNRGEAQLRDESEYQQHKSVYTEDKPENSNRGTMPKGWD